MTAIGLLGVAFVVLKLLSIIDWSWWWVTAPFWGGCAIVLVILALGIFGVGVIELISGIARKVRTR